MKTTDFDKTLRIRPWKPCSGLVPHLTIETNMTCNFRCLNCYNYNRNYIKTLDQIKKEVDLGLKLRKADTITLIGGEPTLHPDLQEIISYISRKGIIAQMLTNGFRFLSDNEDKQLKQLKKNGLVRILLHIDDGQEQYEDPIGSIHKFLRKTQKLDLLTTISWTIYRKQRVRIPDLLREFSGYPNFDGLLCVLEKSVDLAIQMGYSNKDWPMLLSEYENLKQSLSLQPSIFLPSNIDDESVTWLVYMYYINHETQKTFCISPFLTRVYQKLYIRIKKKELFGIPPMRHFFGLTLLFTGIIECLIRPGRIVELLELLKKSKRTGSIRYQYLAVQDGPEYNNEKNMVSICYHCPDATVRNGRICPVCLADRISPLPGEEPPADTPIDLAMSVFEHLQQ
jgi:hypothetical protein